MSIRVNGAGLSQAAKELLIHWQHTRTYWNDSRSRQFESDYLDALPQEVARALAVIEEIDTLLRKVRTDCE